MMRGSTREMDGSTAVSSSLEKDYRVTAHDPHKHGSVSSSPLPEKSGHGHGHGHLHHDPEFTGANVDFSHIDGKKVLRKMDLRLIPMLSILYLLAFLDRGNIGNAKIEHMLVDLKMSGPEYNWVVRYPSPQLPDSPPLTNDSPRGSIAHAKLL